MTNPIQEFSELVAEKWHRSADQAHARELATLIASELRAGGWMAPPKFRSREEMYGPERVTAPSQKLDGSAGDWFIWNGFH